MLTKQGATRASPLRGKLEQWFKRRSPTSIAVTLGLKNVYIFFSREGVLYGLLLVITFITGINYANNLVLGLCFLLASLLVVSMHHTFAQLSGVTIRLLSVGNAQVGDAVEVRLLLKSVSNKPHRQLRLSFTGLASRLDEPLAHLADGSSALPIRQPPADRTTAMVDELQGERLLSLWLPASRRGRVDLPRLTVSSSYPLGVLQAWSYVFLDGHGWAYPAPLTYQGSTIGLAAGEQAAEQQVVQNGQDQFDQLDRYQLGESLARISWGHLARGQGLLSKRFVDSYVEERVLDYYQMPAAGHEDKLRQLRYALDSLHSEASLSGQAVAFRLRLPDGEGDMGQGEAFIKDSLLRLAKTP